MKTYRCKQIPNTGVHIDIKARSIIDALSRLFGDKQNLKSLINENHATISIGETYYCIC